MQPEETVVKVVSTPAPMCQLRAELLKGEEQGGMLQGWGGAS